MIVIMEENATEEQIARVVEKLMQMGFDVHRSTGVTRTVLGAVGNKVVDLRELELLEGVAEVIRVTTPYKLVSRSFRPEDLEIRLGDVVIGGREIILMAGPCAVESREQVLEIADAVRQAGAKILRGGAFKPRTSPYSFQGLGEEGLRYLREAADRYGLLVVSEVMEIGHIPLMSEYVDILQVGARNMQHFNLLKELGRQPKPVLLKRGPAATIEETLLAAEYIVSGGNPNVMLCERGIRTFETSLRYTLDISAIPVFKKLTYLPVIADPSHGTGRRDKVPPMARAAVAAGADGLIIEVHHRPEEALCDGPQALLPEQLLELVGQLRQIAAAVGRTM
jgi:3-deoxy-7-phosphoheptulonate synthase